MNKEELIQYFDKTAAKRDKWYKRNAFYHNYLRSFYASFIPPGKSILEVGCATGNLLASLSPSRGVGIDLSRAMVNIARNKYPHLEFRVADVESLQTAEKFDFIILSDVTGLLFDIWQAFKNLRALAHPNTRIIINSFSYVWFVPLLITEVFCLKMASKQNNWLTINDLKNLLYLADFEVIESGCRLPIPKKIIPFTHKINDMLSYMPFFSHLGVFIYLLAKPLPKTEANDIPCSVIIPCRNEVGNIENCVRRMPRLSSFTEMIFVDGASTDGTVEEIERMQALYKGEKIIKLIHQQAGAEEHTSDKMLRAGKGDAVRRGFSDAEGEILIILDSDLTVAPEDLPKFYLALAKGKADFINGSRLVYPLEKDAMRALNYLGNKIFSLVFTWLLSQPIKDTLCGTKALFKKSYMRIAENRYYFGDFDPFGDFDLLFGAARLNLKIAEIPVRYHPRVYGKIKIERLKHGLLLIKMSWIGFKKLKWEPWRTSRNRG